MAISALPSPVILRVALEMIPGVCFEPVMTRFFQDGFSYQVHGAAADRDDIRPVVAVDVGDLDLVGA